MSMSLPHHIAAEIEGADSTPRLAIREWFVAVGTGELTLEAALHLIAGMIGTLKYRDIANEATRGMMHEDLTKVQAAQVWLEAARAYSPLTQRCDAMVRHPSGRPRRCRWSGKSSSGTCPVCAAALTDAVREAEAHLEKMIQLYGE